MIKTTLTIDGMMCGMCESHMNDVIRKNFTVKKVKYVQKTIMTVTIGNTGKMEMQHCLMERTILSLKGRISVKIK